MSCRAEPRSYGSAGTVAQDDGRRCLVGEMEMTTPDTQSAEPHDGNGDPGQRRQVDDAWRAHGPGVARFATALVGPHDAHDVTTNTFLGIVRHPTGRRSSISTATVEGLPSNADGDRAWLLRDAAGAWYVGWNTPYGSALLSVASATEPVWAEITRSLEAGGHPELWADAVLAAGGAGSADAGADAEAGAPVVTSSVSAAQQGVEQGGVLTTVTQLGPAPATACGPHEGG